MLEFNSARLRLARRRRGLTKVALAQQIGITSRRLWTYENGDERPPEDVISILGEVLNVPVSFFGQPAPEEVTSEGVSFRSFARLTAGQRDAALAAASIAFDFAEAVERVLDFPVLNLPDVRELDPATAAAAVRSEWALGSLPLPNVIHLVESKGCRVFGLVDDVAALDAFSLWNKGRPFIFLTQHKTPERGRWDATHELAHLLLHVGAVPQGRETEREADDFASELLLPADGVLERARGSQSMIEVRSEKLYWRVSALAYIRRLHQLGVLTLRRYKTLVIEATQAGYRRQEGEIDREFSGLWPKAFSMMRDDGVDVSALAAEMGVHPSEIRQMTFSALSSRDGGASPGPISSENPRLRLV